MCFEFWWHLHVENLLIILLFVSNRERQGLTVRGRWITVGEGRILALFKMNLCKGNGDGQFSVNSWDLSTNLQYFFLWECENPHFKSVWQAWSHCHLNNTSHSKHAPCYWLYCLTSTLRLVTHGKGKQISTKYSGKF